jgi:hypothetical protein
MLAKGISSKAVIHPPARLPRVLMKKSRPLAAPASRASARVADPTSRGVLAPKAASGAPKSRVAEARLPPATPRRTAQASSTAVRSRG